MDKDKEPKQPEKRRNLKLVERYENDDYSRFGAPDYTENNFEIGEADFEHSPHSKEGITIHNHGSWAHPGISGGSDEDTWVNEREYKKQTSFIGYGPRGYKRSDDRIYEEVCEELLRDRRVDATNIGIKVTEGVVNLSGKVDSRRTKKIAEAIIENLAGVRDVKNELTIIKRNIRQQGPPGVTKKDLGIE